jgi:hypothetical protein
MVSRAKKNIPATAIGFVDDDGNIIPSIRVPPDIMESRSISEASTADEARRIAIKMGFNVGAALAAHEKLRESLGMLDEIEEPMERRSISAAEMIDDINKVMAVYEEAERLLPGDYGIKSYIAFGKSMIDGLNPG